MSDSVRPQRRQPTRLPRPWDSPGKNTGVGCHFLLQCMEVKSESEVAQSCPTLSDPHGLQPTRLLHPWDIPGKSTGVGCRRLLRCCLKQLEYQAIYEITDKHRNVITERREANLRSPCGHPTLLSGGSFRAAEQEWGTQIEPSDLTELRRQRSLKGPRQL